MILATRLDRLMDQLYAMVKEIINKLKYPDWFNIQKLSFSCRGENEDEERYLELREEITVFLHTLINHKDYSDALTQVVDEKIMEII